MWFHGKVLNERFERSVTWMVLFQAAIINGLILFVKFVSWHPILGIQSWFHLVFSWKSLGFQIVLLLTLWAFAGLHYRHHKVEQFVYSTRFEALCTSIAPTRIFHMFCLSILGAVNVYSYLTLLKTVSNSQNATLLESIFVLDFHSSIFVVLHGLFAGVLFSLKYFSSEWYLLKFNLIQQLNCSLLCSKVTEILSNSIGNVVRPIYWYYILLLIFGVHITNIFSKFFDIESSSDFPTMLYSIINPKLFLAILMTTPVLYFTWCIYIAVFNAFITKRHEFLIDVPPGGGGEKKDEVLNNALVCMEFKLFQYLGYLDLRWLVQFSPARRQNFFAISHPGGHPYNWQALSSTCSTRLSQFLCNISKLTVEKQNGVTKMTAKQVNVVKTDSPDVTKLDGPFAMFWQMVENNVKNWPMYKYFKDELPDTEALRLFTSCQLEIWTVEALGFLIASSYTEDKFGVVQQMLPKLLSLLIDLKLIEEKLPVGVMSFKKYAKDSRSLHKAVSQRHNLKSALESALYRIVLTFKNDIRGVSIPEDHHRYLQKYLEFRQ